MPATMATSAAGATPPNAFTPPDNACSGAKWSASLTLAQHCAAGSASCSNSAFAANVAASAAAAPAPTCENHNSHAGRSKTASSAIAASAANALRRTGNVLFSMTGCQTTVARESEVDADQIDISCRPRHMPSQLDATARRCTAEMKRVNPLPGHDPGHGELPADPLHHERDRVAGLHLIEHCRILRPVHHGHRRARQRPARRAAQRSATAATIRNRLTIMPPHSPGPAAPPVWRRITSRWRAPGYSRSVRHSGSRSRALP